MIRSLLALVSFLSFFALSLIFYPIAFIIKLFSKKASRSYSYFLVRGILSWALWLAGGRVKVVGRENIPEGQALFIGNHNSYIDTFVAFSVVKDRQLIFIGKKELKKLPFINLWFYLIGALFLDRDNLKEGLKVILKGIDELKSGYSVFVFPEGTRSKDGQINTFKEGTMKLAQKSNAPIVPVLMVNTADVIKKHIPFCRKTQIIVEFGKPIAFADIPEEYKKTPAKYVHDVMEESLKKYTNN